MVQLRPQIVIACVVVALALSLGATQAEEVATDVAERAKTIIRTVTEEYEIPIAPEEQDAHMIPAVRAHVHAIPAGGEVNVDALQQFHDGDSEFQHTGAVDEETDDPLIALEVDAMGGAAKTESLKCKCEKYACQCRKECFCKIVEKFKGKKLKVPKGGAKAAAKDKPKSAKKKKTKDITFKCGCEFGGADFSMSKSEGLDCECNGAKCTCTKKCKCTAGGGGAKFREKLPPLELSEKEPSAASSTEAATASAAAPSTPQQHDDGAIMGSLN
eukprot:TRINITY_DN66088_c3_g2_i1.p2 TRINITY_DN66088_c3_g2~~TRINITY_DN66088_c3_g2_i1.p2  ORF type:complete len:272 (+),score=120.93 TRINITY_DN66088_c3_g2_i1:32-847(+)